MEKVSSIFLKHPYKYGMTYLGHMKGALIYSALLFYGCIKAFIHAFFPSIFEYGVTDTLKEVQSRIDERSK